MEKIMEKKSFLWWIAFVLMAIWQLPQTIVALCMIPFIGHMKLVGRYKFTLCFQADCMAGGISLGNFAFVSRSCAKRPATIAHETKGHPWDSYRMGPLYLFIVGLPSILNAMFDFTECYYDWFPERWANKHANLGVDKYCLLYFNNPEEEKDIIV